MIEGRPAAHPRSQGLTKQPAIHQRIHRSIGRLDLNCSQQFVPKAKHPLKSFVNRVHAAKTAVQVARFFYRFSFAKQDDHLAGFSRRDRPVEHAEERHGVPDHDRHSHHRRRDLECGSRQDLARLVEDLALFERGHVDVRQVLRHQVAHAGGLGLGGRGGLISQCRHGQALRLLA